MVENSTASATGAKHLEGGKGGGPVVVAHAEVPDPETKNGANSAQSVGSGGSYPSKDEQITAPNAGVAKQLSELQKQLEALTKALAPAPVEPPMTKEEEELVKVLTDFFSDVEKRLDAKVESRLAKHEEGLKKAALVPVGNTPSAPVPSFDRTAAIDPAMRKEEAMLTKAGPGSVPSFEELTKDIAAGKGIKGRFN